MHNRRSPTRQSGWNLSTALKVDYAVPSHAFFETHTQPTESILPCPPEWINWLRESFIVPRCLIPHGSNDMFSDETQNISMRVFGQETGVYTVPVSVHS